MMYVHFSRLYFAWTSAFGDVFILSRYGRLGYIFCFRVHIVCGASVINLFAWMMLDFAMFGMDVLELISTAMAPFVIVRPRVCDPECCHACCFGSSDTRR